MTEREVAMTLFNGSTRLTCIHKKPGFWIVCDFELWLKTVRKCGHNASLKYISILKMIVLFCMDSGWLIQDPFIRFKKKERR
jgi:hypothetical protein